MSGGKALARIGDAEERAEERRALWRNTVAKSCNDAEFAVFVEIADRLGLDPLSRQIVPARIGGNIVHQVTIDGFRSMAERSGEYRGQTRVEWTADGKTWVDVWTEDNKSPLAARVGVYREGFREPVYAVARTSDYRATGPWWKKGGGAHQIGKCVEALALRKAFPQVLGGLYTSDEIEAAKGGARIVEDSTAPEAEIESIEEAPAPKRAPEWVSKSQAAFRSLAAQFDDPEAWASALNVALKRYKMRQVETAADADHWVRSTLPELGREAAMLVYAGVKKGLNNA